jgi:hypothetical protein
VVASTIVSLSINPRREVITPRKYQAVVWLDGLWPGVADVLFHWRHRWDAGRGYATLPSYARAPETTSTHSVLKSLH